MEIYVDNILVKSKISQNHIEDLEMTFTTLRWYRMKLNPTKCTFKITSSKFLDFMESNRGVEANPKKIQAILEMATPKSTKKV